MLALAIFCQAQSENKYRYEYLRVVANKLNIREKVEESGEMYREIPVNGKKVCVRFSKETNEVEHIGRPLFRQELQALKPSPVYDYLEYSFLNHTFKLDEKALWQKDIVFEKGDWGTLERISNKTSVSISNLYGKRYKVKWTDAKGKSIACLSFPIKYDRMSNTSSEEMEKLFIKSLKNFTLDDSLITPVDGFAEFAELLYLGGERNVVRYPCRLKVHQSNLYQSLVKTNIATVLACARKNGCKPTFGMTGVNDDFVEGVFLLENSFFAYTHVFTIKCSKKDGRLYEITADIHLFIPTHNIKNLNKEKIK